MINMHMSANSVAYLLIFGIIVMIWSCVSSTEEETLEKLLEIQNLDEEICNYGNNLATSVIKQHGKLAKNHKNALENIQLAGSISEGSAIARIFQENLQFADRLNRETEIDIEYTLLEIPTNYKHYIYNIPDKIGYVKVRVDFDLLQKMNLLGWKVADKTILDTLNKITTKEGWLQPYKLKDETLSKVNFQNTNKAVELIIAAAMNKKHDDITIDQVKQDVTKSSVGSEFLIRIDKKPLLQVAFDTVTLFRLPWWPSIAEEWKQRRRNWPKQNFVDKISCISYIIAKPSVDEKHNKETTELRYAFAHVERELVRMRSRHQNLVYLVFKVMLYKYIKPIDSERISSFIGKTIMFWACEEYPPEHEMWSDDYQSTVKALSHLFQQMLNAFESGSLPYFFNKQVNVIEAIPTPIRNKVSKEIHSISGDIKHYLIFPMEKELKGGSDILCMLKSTSEVLNEIKRKDFSRLLRQPKLIGDFLTFYIDEIDFEEIKSKIKREAERIVTQIENEANRFGKKVEKEVKRFMQRFGL